MSDFHESGRNFDDDVGVDGELSSGSVSTGEAIINGENLDGAIIGSTVTFQGDDTAFVSSDGYTSIKTTKLNHTFHPDVIFPNISTLTVALSGTFGNNGDQIDVRLKDFGNGITLLEQTDVNPGRTSLTNTIDANTLTTSFNPAVQIRNSDDATSVSLNKTTIAYGVTL